MGMQELHSMSDGKKERTPWFCTTDIKVLIGIWKKKENWIFHPQPMDNLNNCCHRHRQEYSAFLLVLEVNLQAHYYSSNQCCTAGNSSYDLAWTGVKKRAALTRPKRNCSCFLTVSFELNTFAAAPWGWTASLFHKVWIRMGWAESGVAGVLQTDTPHWEPQGTQPQEQL